MGTLTNISTIKSDVSLFDDGSTRLGASKKSALKPHYAKNNVAKQCFLQLGEESLNILNSPIITYVKHLFAIIRSLLKYLKFIALSKRTIFQPNIFAKSSHCLNDATSVALTTVRH